MRTQIETWEQNVWDKRTKVDPDNELYWSHLALGYFLGLGLSVDDAHDAVDEADRKGLI